MKKLLKLTAAAAALGMALPLTACAGGDRGDEAAANGEVVIFHTNDMHGYVEGDGESVVGIDRIAALHAQTENSLLIDAGDATQGLPIASLSQGADVIELMNAAGYDLMAAGNHEFDFGSEVLKDNAALAEFPIVAANVYDGESPLLANDNGNGCNAILQVNGIDIGFFGLTTADTATSVNPELLGGVTFADEAAAAKEQIDILSSAGVDAIVAVCHLGDESGGASCTAARLAEEMTGEYAGAIDVIIDAHSHTVENTEINGTLIVQTGGNGSAAGKLTLSFEDGVLTAEEQLLTPADLADIQPHGEVSGLLGEIMDEQDELLAAEIGDTNGALWGGNIGAIAIARVVETNLGDLTADAFVAAAEQFMAANGIDMPVVGVENAGGIRGGIFGTATMGQLVTAFPYSNTLYLKQVTPAVLYEMMEISGAYIDGQDEDTGMLLQQSNSGGFLQVGGFKVVYDASAPAGGQHVISITLEGQTQPLGRDDNETEIMLVSNNYIMSGGNGYDMLAGLPKAGELGGELEAVLTYLESCIQSGDIAEYVRPQGRIVMQGDYVPEDYTAKIYITVEGGAAAGGTEVRYTVDGGETLTATTDADGAIYIEVTDGAHTVCLEGGEGEVYIDNYLGLGIVEDAFRQFPVLELN